LWPGREHNRIAARNAELGAVDAEGLLVAVGAGGFCIQRVRHGEQLAGAHRNKSAAACIGIEFHTEEVGAGTPVYIGQTAAAYGDSCPDVEIKNAERSGGYRMFFSIDCGAVGIALCDVKSQLQRRRNIGLAGSIAGNGLVLELLGRLSSDVCQKAE
jgi:hypothetical protein